MVAFGEDNYELPKIPLTNTGTSTEAGSDDQGGNEDGDEGGSDPTGSGLPGADTSWEGPGVPLTTKPSTTKDTRVPVSKCSITGIKTKAYTGKAITQAITVKYGSKTLKVKTDYTVAYKSNKNVGVATLIVTGKGGYKGSVTKTFKIIPKGTAVSKLAVPVKNKKPVKKALKVTWKAQKAQTNGYQIQYSTSAKFTKKTTKAVFVTNNKTTAKTISKLASGKKYYVRIRTYKNVSGTKYYSSWSAAKALKTK